MQRVEGEMEKVVERVNYNASQQKGDGLDFEEAIGNYYEVLNHIELNAVNLYLTQPSS